MCAYFTDQLIQVRLFVYVCLISTQVNEMKMMRVHRSSNSYIRNLIRYCSGDVLVECFSLALELNASNAPFSTYVI